MRRSLFILASLALSSALYAQAEPAPFSREQVLEIFSQYNPSVLEQAQADADYNSILESFLASYESSRTPMGRYELIAVARNFDNSIRLQALTDVYKQTATASSVMGGPSAAAEQLFRKDLTDVVGRIWAVTVQLRSFQLKEAKARLKSVRADKMLSKEVRTLQADQIKAEIRALKAEIKSLQKHRGEIIQSAVDAYVLQTQKQASQGLLRAARSSLDTAEAENLQVKSNHKKPVAK